ncbi:hypothetical protein [Pseudoalteromonas sp. Of7M-16]|uniref:hypothetical protein n=1 Tax=Pseudoalteromonas sp. Of7M-16 TaxID=2917756 RepID=UPI001EF6A518|nr:hypothetical protein [Pseudoalteromonas sp. Of7M-16]MCG7547498.1 hypothetical protein [Pseudoalteromonas sp. Of7M-16]
MKHSIRHYKVLVFPSFWVNAFAVAVKEYWLYLAVFFLIYNGSSLMRGELLNFITSCAVSATVVSILYIFYILFLFPIKSIKDANFRKTVNTESSKAVTRYLLGVKIEEPKTEEPQAESRVSLGEEFPGKTSKIMFGLLMVVKVCTAVGAFYIWYLIANKSA